MSSPDPADEAAFARALAAARTGRPEGFEWLWHRFARPVTAFARLQGSDDPEGIANLAFATAFGRLDRFGGSSSSFVSFVFAIARNKLVDERRRRGRRPVTSWFGTTPDRIGGDVELDAFAGLSPTTADALRSLTADQREVLFLRLVADLPIEEVARVTGRRPGAVKAMQHRALAALRREISPEAVSP